MCFLRGLCFAKQNAFDRAKDCYKISVQIDVQNFEAFDQLMKNSLMSPDEEWEFIESLDFDSIRIQGSTSASQEAAAFTKNLYITRLSKYKNTEALTAATEDLSTHYNLSQNPDILLSRAELLFTQCRFRQTLSITTSILEADKHNFAIYPLHLACLHELNQKSALFLIAHELTNSHPEEPCAWLAVGTYYLTTNRIAEARRYFSKASMMDPHFGPAWIGFAHTFAAEGEHDQAISAYSTAARLFQGTHLPQLYLGMQNLQLNQMTLADEYFTAAYGLCNSDPLLLNERGVVAFHQDHLQDAIRDFSEALTLATAVDAEPAAFISTRANLAHAYRRTGAFDEALHEFEDVLRIGGKNAGVFTAKGLVLLELGRTHEAIVAFHEALAVSPQDPIATDLLSKALEENAEMGVIFGDLGEDDEAEFEHLVQGARQLAKEKARTAAAATASFSTSSSGRRKGKTRERNSGSGRGFVAPVHAHAPAPVPTAAANAASSAMLDDGSSMMAVSEDDEED